MIMKRIYKGSTIVIMTFALVLSCNDDFLDVQPKGALSVSQVTDQKGLEALLVAAYSMLDAVGEAIPASGVDAFQTGASNWVYGGITGGDAHKGPDEGDQPNINPIERYEASSVNNYFNIKWGVTYEGVNRCNSVLKVLAQAKGVSDEVLTRIAAEARTLRGYYHFEAKRMWGNIPFVDETAVDPGKVPNNADAWPAIEADLKFGIDNLPATMPHVGRVNSWVAKAILGKAYMYQKKYAEAKTLLLDVYTNGVNPLGVKFGLNPTYHTNFYMPTKNSMESVFAAQASVNDGGGSWNGNAGDVLNFPYLSGGSPGGCCGFYQPSFEFANSFRTTAGGLPMLDGSYNSAANALKTDMNVESTDPYTPDTGPVDPRLDWTVGRRGIPYLDWGPHTGKNWTRKQSYGGPYSPKKNTYYKSQSGAFTDKSSWTEGYTASNVNIIRYADVILWLAEIEVETGSLTQARTYVNLIRARAANPAGFVMNGAVPAANYVVSQYPTGGPSDPFGAQNTARAAVHFERKLELGMEGHRFFDLVRWDEAETTLNAYLNYEKTILLQLQGAKFDAMDKLYPIPQRQIDLSGTDVLTQNPGY
jgi:starch-binding outer membrane protein, SusD/RagB family